jgi:hypothetical protein
MKKTLIGGIAVTLATLGITLAAPASADAQTYGYQGDHNAYALALEMSTVNWQQSPVQARQTAIQFCGDHYAGWSRNDILRNLEPRYDTSVAVWTVMGAEYHFCPAYDSLHQQDEGGPVDAYHPYVPQDSGGSPSTGPGTTV